ncbi:MAG TPA: tail fiber domain-containing protein, partial [Dissulfurispiraceae bacterium]|nr:tail fiber domain-containing protein [Dissulfurispiraceae bacterium]
SPDLKAVMAGSGPTGYRVMTRSGCAVGATCAVTTRMMIDYDGNVGFGIVPAHPLHMASGAHVTAGGVWMNASSRKYKDHIQEIALEDALKTLRDLNPVTFSYKADPSEKHVGFVAEDVPELVATKDRRGLSPMDIVAVMTKVVQEQQSVIERQRNDMEKQQRIIDDLSARLERIERAMHH